MKWIVGTDLGAHSTGALRMAAWLQGGGDRRTSRLVGVCVLDERLRGMVGEPQADEIIAATSQRLRQQVEGLRVAGAFADLRAVLAESPEAGLTAGAETIGVDGIVIGRAARTDDSTPRRLGSVARRILRHLPAPVMVVPPDLDVVGTGPVVFATDLREFSVRAAKVAGRLAGELGRELLVVHVDPALVLTTSQIGYGVPMPIEMRPRTLEDLHTWNAHHGLGSARARLLEGNVIDRILHCARQTQSPLVVCGSRRLSLAERIFSSSVGTELARRADRAVLVVPPEAR